MHIDAAIDQISLQAEADFAVGKSRLRLNRRLWCAAPLIAWVLVAGLTVLVDRIFIDHDRTLRQNYGPEAWRIQPIDNQSGPPIDRDMLAANSRVSASGLVCITSIVVYGMAALTTLIAAAAYFVTHAIKLFARVEFWLLLAACLGMLIIYFMLCAGTPFYDLRFTYKGFGDTIRSADSTGASSRIIEHLKLSGTLGWVSAYALLFISCMTLIPIRSQSCNLSVQAQKSHTRWNRAVLVLGALLVYVAFFRDRAFFVYAREVLNRQEGLMPDSVSTGSSEIVATLGAGINTASGIMYTLMLIAVYVPASVVLRQRTLLMARELSPACGQTVQEWLSFNGLDHSGDEWFRRGITIFAPALITAFLDYSFWGARS